MFYCSNNNNTLIFNLAVIINLPPWIYSKEAFQFFFLSSPKLVSCLLLRSVISCVSKNDLQQPPVGVNTLAFNQRWVFACGRRRGSRPSFCTASPRDRGGFPHRTKRTASFGTLCRNEEIRRLLLFCDWALCLSGNSYLFRQHIPPQSHFIEMLYICDLRNCGGWSLQTFIMKV